MRIIALPPSGLICIAAVTKFFRMPWPIPKKSPIGHSTLGSRQPSQYISITIFRG